MSIFERSYGKIFTGILKVANPIKKKIITTECQVHKFINNRAILILKNDGYIREYNYLSSYIDDINTGAVWADQDFKSSNHFFNPYKEKGLYGRNNALNLCLEYYSTAIKKYHEGDIKNSMFYFGAACHIAQDMTVPQHVNVKLLSSHRKYEQWIIRSYKKHDKFSVNKGGIYLNSIKRYVYLNSKAAMQVHNRYRNEENEEKKFYKMTSIILILAQKTTAGIMLKFFNDTKRMHDQFDDKTKVKAP